MKIRRANSYQVRACERANQLLRDALACARTADCPKLVRRIRAAIASGGGAQRHIQRRVMSRQVFGVLHVSNTDRRQFRNVEGGQRQLALAP
jgi:hypothetical protein